MYNPFSLSGKRILVTGASSGIGRAIAVECSKSGASLIITARNKERLDETLSLMENSDIHKKYIFDLRKPEDISMLVNSFDEKIDGIVNCAGLTKTKLFQNFTNDDIGDVFSVNFHAPVLLTQKLLKLRKIQKNASIVFISSISGVYCSSVGGSLYSASKGAVNGIVKGMALDLSNRGIRVNCVNPGMIETKILSEGVVAKEQLQEDIKLYPLKRYGKPEEVAYAVIYLLSDASQWITGSNLLIDGGYTLL